MRRFQSYVDEARYVPLSASLYSSSTKSPMRRLPCWDPAQTPLDRIMDFCAQEAPPLVKSQRGAVLGYLHGGRWTLVREFVDVNDFNDIAGAPIEQSVA